MQLKKCYLTIDDCPSSGFAEKLETLIDLKIPAIFFCIGKNLEKYQSVIIEAINEGFIIGNHSYSHPHFSELSLKDTCREIDQADQIIDYLYEKAVVKRPVKWFRFPYGDKGDGKKGFVFKRRHKTDFERKNFIQYFLRDLGYTQPGFKNISYEFYKEAGLLHDVDWHWTFDVMEWMLFQDKRLYGLNNIESIYERLRSRRPPDCRGLRSDEARWMGNMISDEIILLHDHIETTPYFKNILEHLLSLPLEFELPAIRTL